LGSSYVKKKKTKKPNQNKVQCNMFVRYVTITPKRGCKWFSLWRSTQTLIWCSCLSKSCSFT